MSTSTINFVTKTYSPVMLIAEGNTNLVNAVVTINLGKSEGGVQPPTDYCMTIDNSPSISEHLESIQQAAEKVVNSLRSVDRLCIVAFNSKAELVLSWVNCDDAGKARARKAIWAIFTTGGTNFASGLQIMLDQFAKTEAAHEKRGLFLTDGQDAGSGRVELCTRLKEIGVMVYFGGFRVRNDDEAKMQEMATANSVVTNFKPLSNPDDIMSFFAEVQAAAAITAFKNCSLRFNPIAGVTVRDLELVLRAKQLNYVAAPDPGRSLVKIGDMGHEEVFDLFVCISVVQGSGITEGMNSFGKLELLGEKVGSSGEIVLAKGYLRVQYAKVQPAGLTADQDVREVMGLATAQREFAAAANPANAASAAKHFAAAEEAVRKTKPFNRGGALSSLEESLKEAAAAATPEQKQQAARRATTRFSATARLRAMGSN